ncbi:FidL [Candidatus Symbiopectobacterium sp. NZEC151]|uniref:FidL n=2 Tax=unclassified Symbiopectobacterium TaxID=2794573 RepID=UPI002226342F|nr:FidL [Candidatus Symbiopectobacterium sp. NZEC151]MCW2475975.1 FidL [Candidatus Symbiopectobacterium sp. NZEC151]
MLIIKIRKKIALTIGVLVFFSLACAFFLFYGNRIPNPLVCQGKVKSSGMENGSLVRKEYDVYIYLSDKERALVLISGVYVGSDNVIKTLRRTLSFDPQWTGNHLKIRNFAVDKHINDNAPDDTIPWVGENDVVKFEMLMKDVYLVSSVHSKVACQQR